MSRGSKGKKLNQSHKDNISKVTSGELNGMYGRTHSNDSVSKNIQSNQNRVTCYDLVNKEFIKIHKTQFIEFKDIRYVGVRSKLIVR